MNCDAVRRRLLEEEQLDRPSGDELRRHIAGCPSCRALSRRLTLIERQIPRLHVPPSSTKSAFVRRFLHTGGPVVKHIPLPWPKPVKERGLQKLSLAVAIAAVLAVFTLAWWSWPRLPAPPPPAVSEPTWVAQVRKEREAIRQLEPAQRVTKTGALAAKLRRKAESLLQAGDAEGLATLATVYGEVVRNDLYDGASALPAAERAAVLADAMQELVHANSKFLGAAVDASHSGAATSRSLQQMADAAGDGMHRLQELLKAA